MNTLDKFREYQCQSHDTPPPSLGKKILLIFKRWHHNHSSRYVLKDLPDHLLDDIGMNKEEAEQESRKPFWK